MSRGIVVDHRVARVRYAISEHHFNEDVHKFVRELTPRESVLSYRPRRVHRLGEAEKPVADLAPAGDPGTPESAAKSESGVSEPLAESNGAPAPTHTEGSASAESQEKKEGN